MFFLIKETNERYVLWFTQHKVSSNVNDKVFSDFIIIFYHRKQ